MKRDREDISEELNNKKFNPVEDLDDEYLDDELNLPPELINIPVSQKRDLLRFKSRHSEVRSLFYL